MEGGKGFLDSPRARQLDDLFSRALDLPEGAERQAFLDSACGGDGELRNDVEMLLRAAVETDPLFPLDGDPPSPAGRAEQPEPTAGELPRFGPYQLLREIGRGGMGTVFLAERADGQYEKRVALKVLRVGADHRSLAFFHRERQILANLEHPSIARLYDGGTTPEGDPYLVMEYVSGQGVDRYCEERGLALRQRLRLFIAVCQAVQAAHRQMVVHHDIKPSNILVDGEGGVKLLDFGISQLLATGEDHPAWNEPQPLTPQYASPEQIAARSTSASSDIYQLGLLAYELLSGRRPYELSGLKPWRWKEVICDTPLPPPSAASGAGELAGDLDAIILKTLSKDPAHRYGSVDMLCQDLESYLEGRPVSARPSTWHYRLGKFIGRHRAALTVSVLVTVVFLAMSVAFVLRLAEERDRAEQNGRDAEQAVDFLVDLFDLSNPYRDSGEPPSIRQVLDRGAERLDREFDGRPKLRARLLYNLGKIYRQMGQSDQARQLGEEALAIRQSTPGIEPGVVAESLQEVARIDTAAGDVDTARAKLESALGMVEAALGPDHPNVASLLNDLGRIELQRGNYTTSQAYYRRAYEIFVSHRGARSLVAAITLQNLGILALDQGRWDEAEDQFEQVLAVYEEKLSDDHPRVAEVLNNLAVLHAQRGEYTLALAHWTRVLELREKNLGPEHPMFYPLLVNLSEVHKDAGSYDEAERFGRRALALHRSIHGEGHPWEAFALSALGKTFAARGELEEAEVWLRQALALFRSRFPSTRWRFALTQCELAEVLAARGNDRGAEELLEESRSLLEEVFDDDNPYVVVPIFHLAEIHHRRGQMESAETLYRRALAVRSAVMPITAPERREAAGAYGGLLRQLGREREAGIVEAELALPPLVPPPPP